MTEGILLDGRPAMHRKVLWHFHDPVTDSKPRFKTTAPQKGEIMNFELPSDMPVLVKKKGDTALLECSIPSPFKQNSNERRDYDICVRPNKEFRFAIGDGRANGTLITECKTWADVVKFFELRRASDFEVLVS